MKKIYFLITAFVVTSSIYAQTGVGIGSVNPVERLDVNGAVKLGTTTNTNDGTIRWTGTDFEGRKSGAWVTLTSSGDADWTVSGNNQYSAVSQNVGIGTTSPSAKFDLVGTLQYTDGNQGLNKVLTSDANGNASWNTLANDGDWTVSGNTQYSAVSGNVGIGTPSPAAKLDVSGQIKIQGGSPGANKILTSDANGLATWQDAPNDGDWTVSGNNIYLGVSGNVGVGTNAPAAKLNVFNPDESINLPNFTQTVANSSLLITSQFFSNTYVPGIVWNTSNNNATKPKAGILMRQEANGSKLILATSNNYSTGITNTAVTIDKEGNVGIGTGSPARSLHVSSVLRLEPLASAPSLPSKGDMYFNSTDNKLKVYDGSTWQDCW